MRALGLISALAVSLAVASAAQGTTITSLVGDKDGFGLVGAPAVPVAGTWSGLGGTFPDDNRTGGDPLFTDIWEFEQTPGGPLASPISYMHTYALPGTITSASLFLNEAGMSDARGPWDVSFNGTSIGTIGVFPSSDGETFKLLSFSVPVGLLTGADAVTLTYQDTVSEGFAINFSELVIAVPEASTALLLACGLLSLGVRRRLH